MDSELLHLVKSCKLFSSLTDEACEEFIPFFEKIALKQDETLFYQGDAPEFLFILLSGKLSAALTTADGENKQIGYINPGDPVGELGALTNEPRSLTIKALHNCTLLRLPSAAFIDVCQRHPTVMFAVIHPIAARSQEIIELFSAESAKKHIVCIPANNDVSLQIFSDKLSAILKDSPSVVLLSDYDSEFTNKNMDLPALRTFCNNLNNERTATGKKLKRYFIYLPQSDKTPLANFCSRKADSLYIIGIGDAIPHLDKTVLKKLQNTMTNAPELVLLHQDNVVLPSHTSSWLRKTSFAMHHHIRIGQDADYERLVRFMRGKAVGLVLSGGGTRGWAHLGAIKALMESGIPIDAVGGTSAGAIVGGCFAIHQNYADSYQKFEQIVETSRHSVSWKSLTWPIISLFDAKNFTVSQQNAFGEIQIEDLWLPYFCISSKLSNNTEAVHRTGYLWEKTRSSSSLPGIIPPMVSNGELHFDGGLINNLPVDIMRPIVSRKGKIIAIELTGNTVDRNKYFFPPVLTLKEALLTKLGFGFKEYKIPHFVDTFLKALFLGSALRARQNGMMADIFVDLDLAQFSMLHADTKQAKEMVEVGYQMTMKQIKSQKIK